MQRYFAAPYQFIPPFRSRLWPRLVSPFVSLYRRRVLGIPRLEVRGAEHLRDSLKRGAGVVLAPNHWSLADGPLIGELALRAGAYCYYLVSYHIFRRHRVRAWLLNRLGCYSVLREGTDRESLRASVRVLTDADRPLAIFAEGTWYRQNDCVGPMQQGVALIAQKAARLADHPIVVHPVAIKYWLLENPRPALERRLAALEKHFGFPDGREGELFERIDWITAAWLAALEGAYLGHESTGDAEDRRENLLAELLGRMETEEFGQASSGPVMDRVRRLRGVNVPRLAAANPADAAAAAARLDALLHCEFLFSHSLTYHREKPSWERVAETVQRLVEVVWDRFERPVVPMGVVMAVGPAIDVRDHLEQRPSHGDQREALTARVAADIQGLLDRLSAEGPPRSWNVVRPYSPEPGTSNGRGR
jgi:1-acyl-sn-glycerol-3-phosphate acyltransferase